MCALALVPLRATLGGQSCRRRVSWGTIPPDAAVRLLRKQIRRGRQLLKQVPLDLNRCAIWENASLEALNWCLGVESGAAARFAAIRGLDFLLVGEDLESSGRGSLAEQLTCHAAIATSKSTIR